MRALFYEAACIKYAKADSDKLRAEQAPAKKLYRSLSNTTISSIGASIAASAQQQTVISHISDVSDSNGRSVRESTGASESSALHQRQDVGFTYARLKGRDSMVTCFIDQYIARTKAYRNIVATLGDNSSTNRAKKTLYEIICRLQLFCRNRLVAKSMWK